jgi:hypothetical protein
MAHRVSCRADLHRLERLSRFEFQTEDYVVSYHDCGLRFWRPIPSIISIP